MGSALLQTSRDMGSIFAYSVWYVSYINSWIIVDMLSSAFYTQRKDHFIIIAMFGGSQMLLKCIVQHLINVACCFGPLGGWPH